MQLITQLKEKGYQVTEKWECEWHAEKNADTQMKNSVHAYHIAKPLHAQEALFGGHMNALKLYHEAIPGETVIQYYDIKSLYPFVNSCRP